MLRTHRATVLPTVWSSRSMTKVAAFLTFVSPRTATLAHKQGQDQLAQDSHRFQAGLATYFGTLSGSTNRSNLSG